MTDLDTYRHLMIAAAEVRYLAGLAPAGQERARKIQTAVELEKMAADVKPDMSGDMDEIYPPSRHRVTTPQ